MGFETTAGYIAQMIARGLASNDEEIVITHDGRLVYKTPPNMKPASSPSEMRRRSPSP
jgi:hypothetical protein